MNQVLYIKCEKCTEVDKTSVTIGDIASLECASREIVQRVKTMKILTIHPEQETRYVVSVLLLIARIQEVYPSLQIENLGESDFVVELMSRKDKGKRLAWLKMCVVWVILFFGGAFAIMSFNNDISVEKLFSLVYEQVTGNPSDGFTIIEVMYSIGIFLGIMIFYNHFGPKKISRDPTPMEVEMRLYEQDINQTLIDGVNRKDAHLDVE